MTRWLAITPGPWAAAALAIATAACPMPAAAGADADTAGVTAAVTRGPRPGRLEAVEGREEGVVPERIDRERSTWLRGGGAAVDLATRAIVGWGACPPWPVGPAVLLADGGVVAGTIEAADATRVAVRSPCLGRLDLPADLVAGYRRSQATGPGPLRLRAPAGDVLLANGDVVTGDPASWRDGELAVDTAAGRVTIPADLIQAVDFRAPRPAAGAASRPRLLVAFADGSRVPVADLRPAAEPDRFEIAIDGTADGAVDKSIDADGREKDRPPPVARCDRADVAAVAVDGGAARLLASLTPAAFAERPIVGPAWPLAVNRTLTGDWPAARGATGFSALGIHAPATVRYRLERPAARFQARVAIDDSAAGRGAVTLRVMARPDGGAWREAFASPVVRGGEPAVECDIPLDGAAEIELVADAADEADVLARTIWLDPRVVAAP